VVDVGEAGVPRVAAPWQGGFLPLEFNQVLVRQAANDEVLRTARQAGGYQGLVDALDVDRWFAVIDTLDDYNRYTWPSTGSAVAGNVHAARDWLVAQFEQSLPHATVATEEFLTYINAEATYVPSYNVIATVTGTSRADEWFIIGGHYDARSQSHLTSSDLAPGAEDNASGCAGVLELARVFARYRPPVTVIYVCYSGEEQGLWGSSDHASGLVTSGDDAKVQAMLNMDMIGYTGNLANPDVLLETENPHLSLHTVFSAAAAAYTDLIVYLSYTAWGSDHAPYIDGGMPALLTIEFDWNDYDHYHRTTDTADKIVPEMGLKILRMNLAAMAELMGVLFVDGFEAGTTDSWEVGTEP
jgi:hypothetical protein